MRFILGIGAALGLAACGGTTTPMVLNDPTIPAERNATLAATPPEVAPRDADLAGLLNDVRIDTGAGALRYDARLDRAAQSHAGDMVTNDYFAHTGRNGSSIMDRARAEGYDATFLAENIARGQMNAGEAFDAWQRSPGHRANMLDPRAEDFGLGVAGEGFDTRWVLVLGAE